MLIAASIKNKRYEDIILFLISSALILSSWKKDEVRTFDASFSVGDTLLKVQQTIAIATVTKDASLYYLWDFGDGLTATGSTPVHSYAAPGKYVITLTISDTPGKTKSSTTQAVRVGEFYAYEIDINTLSKDSGAPDYTPWTSSDVFVRLNEYNGATYFTSTPASFNASPLTIAIPNVKIRYEQNSGLGTEIRLTIQRIQLQAYYFQTCGVAQILPT